MDDLDDDFGACGPAVVVVETTHDHTRALARLVSLPSAFCYGDALVQRGAIRCPFRRVHAALFPLAAVCVCFSFLRHKAQGTPH